MSVNKPTADMSSMLAETRRKTLEEVIAKLRFAANDYFNSQVRDAFSEFADELESELKS